jgi:transcriptional regulator with XRE-family HTH domain
VSFGETLRQLRKQAGLTQADLAERSKVSERTISKLERGAPCSAGTAGKLATALGLAGTAHGRFVAAATAGDGGNEIPLAVAAATRTLPHDVGNFTGREVELRQLREFADAADSRGAPLICVIHGMAGVGKSALAVHFSHEVAHRFPDGQLYVRLHGHEDCYSTTPAAARRSARCSRAPARPWRLSPVGSESPRWRTPRTSHSRR